MATEMTFQNQAVEMTSPTTNTQTHGVPTPITVG